MALGAIRSLYTPYSIYFRGTITLNLEALSHRALNPKPSVYRGTAPAASLVECACLRHSSSPRLPVSNLGIWGFPKIRGYLFGDPYNEDYGILGSILGYPNFGKLPCRV